MTTEIEEPIDVSASFVRGHLRPSIFYWQGRMYRIRKILGSYHDTKGRFRRYFYSVQAGTPDVYEVCLDTEDMRWWLVKIHSES